MAKKVLIIDDEKDMRVYLEALFRKEGYETTTAENGKEGLWLAEAKRPDLITLDVLMPKNRDMVVAVGGEVWFVDMLALRAGYKTGVEMGNLSFGAGFRISDFQLDYTYTDHEDFDATHRISLTMAFGE